MRNPVNFSSIKDIHWRKILPTFLVLVISFNTFFGSLLYIHYNEDISHKSAIILHKQQNQTNLPLPSSDNHVLQGDLLHCVAHTQGIHILLFLAIFTVSLPLLFWVTLLLTNEREIKNQLQKEKNQTSRLNTLLQTIIQIHRLIDREKEKQGLTQTCCDLLISSHGYASAWIILLDQQGKVETSAESGSHHNFDELKRLINSGGQPSCIDGCIDHQGLITIDTPATFCVGCPLANGYPLTGIMCASIEHDATAYGYLNVSLSTDFTQNQEDKDRFREIAGDIGYALFNLEQQQQKHQMRKALRQSEERLRSLTENAQDAILMMDPQGAISFWNPASEKIFGYSAAEALGKNLHSLLAPSRYHAAHQAAFPEFVHTGQGKAIGKTVELIARRQDAREIPITLSLSAFFQDGGWNAIGILRDMTDHKLMEERVLQSQKMSTIAGLAAGVAHEINTPLSAILQSIQVIRQSLDPNLARNREFADLCGLDLVRMQDYFDKREISFFMDGIRDSAIKSGAIISNLLQFSRPQTLEREQADLALLLDQAVELAKSDYNLKKNYDILNIEISRDYAPNLPPVSCVAVEIEQVFINLLKNAVQAIGSQPEPKPKPRITLSTLQNGEMIRVEIADNGPGIDAETRPHLFEPFFTTKDIGVGTGLGLSVAYTIVVTKHNGHLNINSEPGHGATFIVDLPLI
jgi:PAS domain S-box-containing protein